VTVDVSLADQSGHRESPRSRLRTQVHQICAIEHQSCDVDTKFALLAQFFSFLVTKVALSPTIVMLSGMKRALMGAKS
jgi:hypothetical protein